MCMYCVHLRCAKLRKKDLKHLCGDAIWFCKNCKSALPFHDIWNEELLYLYNYECSFHNNNSSQSWLLFKCENYNIAKYEHRFNATDDCARY